MDVQIRSYRGIERAEVHMDPIAIVAGRNGVGKTSITEGAAAALAGEPLPIFEGEKPAMKKKDANELVAAGAKRGKAVVASSEGSSWVNWPGAKAQTEGKPPQASAVATGLIDWPALPEKRRAATLQDLLQAAPTFQDLEGAVADELVEYTDEDRHRLASVWEQIERDGWDATHKAYQDELSRAKGRWEEATGERWGSDKAENWVPEGWDPGLNDIALDDWETALADAKERADQARKAQAVNEDRRAQLQEKAADLETAQAEKRQLDDQLSEAQTQLHTIRAEYNQMAAQPDAHCPECGVALAIPEGDPQDLTIYEGEPADTVTLQAKREGVQAQHERLEALRQQRDEAAAKVQAAGNAQAELEAMPEPDQGDGDSDLASLDEQVDRLRQKRQAKVTMDRAREAHTEAVVLGAIVTALAPSGVRRQALVRALDSFNKHQLYPASAYWDQTVWLDEDFLPHYGQRPWHLLSLSEAYRVRVSVRLAFADLDGSDAVILDGADVLDAKGRKHLIHTLVAAFNEATFPDHYMVGITLNRPDQAPDLEGHGLGYSYWVEEGKANPIHHDSQGAA
ncbi:hypothetical protein [Thiohalorhabdus sp.]|uniref:hypothetical protein n=1 Tax=Thiohalorhabdus sp. TaxID=3094134 RepID=UPI002FC3301E